jgi:hypothetical protein
MLILGAWRITETWMNVQECDSYKSGLKVSEHRQGMPGTAS